MPHGDAMTKRSTEPSLAFSRVETLSELVSFGIKSWIFGKLTRKSSDLFVRGRDVISVRSQIGGVWEPTLTELIAHFADCGHDDFLIDIGANIGLVSSQSGNRFKRVHMFEPNPHCCNLIEVNTAIALTVPKTLHRYGLGESDKTCRLTVPKHNWGGAFVDDGANAYDKATLALKDGFATYSEDNYFQVDIEIRDGAKALSAVFSELAAEGLTRGVVKIDVEGYELVVLKGIAAAIPPETGAVILLESWSETFPMANVLGAFGTRATAYKLHRDVPWKPGASPLAKLAALVSKPRIATRIVPVAAGDDCRGDLILTVAAIPPALAAARQAAVLAETTAP